MTEIYLFLISDISLDVPDELDLSVLRGKGIQLGEEELPESNGNS